MRMLMIVNPIAGRGKATQRASALAALLTARGHVVDVQETRQAGDAEGFAARLSPDCERLIVAGGDGTLNEVLNGLKLPITCPLAHLAVGTANLIAKELHLPRQLERFANLLDSENIVHASLGVAAGRRFIAVGSCGFDAEVTRHVRELRSGRLGYLGYVQPIGRTLFGFEEPRMSVTLDGAQTHVGGLVIVSNIKNYGGLIKLADQAELDSGHFDVCILPRARIIDLLRTVVAAVSGGISRSNVLIYRTARSVRVESARPLPVQLDGDYTGESPVEFAMLSESVPLLSAHPAHCVNPLELAASSAMARS